MGPSGVSASRTLPSSTREAGTGSMARASRRIRVTRSLSRVGPTMREGPLPARGGGPRDHLARISFSPVAVRAEPRDEPVELFGDPHRGGAAVGVAGGDRPFDRQDLADLRGEARV